MKKVLLSALMVGVVATGVNAFEIGGVDISGGLSVGWAKMEHTGDGTDPDTNTSVSIDHKVSNPVFEAYLKAQAPSGVYGKVKGVYFKGDDTYTLNYGGTIGQWNADLSLKRAEFEVGYAYNNRGIILTPFASVGYEEYKTDFGDLGWYDFENTFWKVGLEVEKEGQVAPYVNMWVGRTIDGDSDDSRGETIDVDNKWRYGGEIGLYYKRFSLSAFYEYVKISTSIDHEFDFYGVKAGVQLF